MNRLLTVATTSGIALLCLSGCSSSSSPSGTNPAPTSYIDPTNSFVGWADDTSLNASVTPIGTYGGKKQVMRGTLDFLTGLDLGQPAGVEIYEGSDGHVYAVDLTSVSSPAPVQLSSEAAATIDDTCTLSGSEVSGANYNYSGTYFTADLVTPANSSYFYRLPGPDGICDTSDDVIHLVKTGMSGTDAPIVASAMPVNTVHTAEGGISGFVTTSGADLVLVDSNFANPVTLGSFAATIGVADPLPVGTTQGYPTGQLYVVDGNIVFVDYAGHSISSSLFTIPNWSPTKEGADFVASVTTLYFSINTPAAGQTAASTTIYSMPSDGSAAPSVIDSEPGQTNTLLVPIGGTNLIWGVSASGAYSIKTLAEGTSTPVTLLAGTESSGTFIATTTTVYYTTWDSTSNSQALTVTHTNTTSGILGLDGTVIAQPIANSTFVNGGEQLPWPADTTTTDTALETVFLVENLVPVTVLDASTGYQYTEDGVSSGTMIAIDTATNVMGQTVGTLPDSSAITMNGSFRNDDHTGFIESANPLSTQDPATRDLYLLNTQSAASLSRLTSNL